MKPLNTQELQERLKKEYPYINFIIHGYQYSYEKFINIIYFEVNKNQRGKSYAKKFLQHILNYAYERNIIIGITPSNAFGAEKERLTQFYKTIGFQENVIYSKNKEKYIKTPDNLVHLKE